MHTISPPREGGSGTSRRAVLGGGVAAAVAVGATGLLPEPAQARRPPRQRPNVVVVSVDDLAWNALGCTGNDFHETPNIDRLAARGMRFTQAYAASPVCSPSRAAMMTGLYPARVGITNFLRDQTAPSNLYLEPRYRAVPKAVNGRGYRSALIGKWHLTEDYSGPYRQRQGNPYDHGFDDVLLSEEKYIGWCDYFFPYRFMPGVRGGKRQEYLTDRISRDLADYVRKHRRTPFFIHVSNYATHYKWKAPKGLIRKYKRKKRRNPEFRSSRYRPAIGAMVERVDRQVGLLVRALRDAGIEENTLILITSDNGGAIKPSNRPLQGGKGSLNEGGIRIPLVAYWPGTIEGGVVSDAVVSSLDILPTVSRLAGAGGAGRVDGVDLSGLLLGGAAPDRELYWYYPHHLSGAVPSAAVRSGRYKLIKRLRTRKLELYDITVDPRERRNLATREKAVTRRLHRKLERHLRAVDRVPGPPDSERFSAVYPRGRVAGRAASEVFSVVAAPAPAGSGGLAATRVGLVRDESNSLLVDYDPVAATVGWRLLLDGVPQVVEPEPLGGLAGTVDLGAPGARLGLSMADGTVAVYVDQGRGAGWEYLFLVDVDGAVDLSDPAVRQAWRLVTEAPALPETRFTLRTG